MHWRELRLVELDDRSTDEMIARPLHAAGDLLHLPEKSVAAIVPIGLDAPLIAGPDPSVVYVDLAPMTETVKEVHGVQILHTIDRETLYVASFPVVASGAVLAAAASTIPSPEQLIGILTSGRWPVRSLEQGRA